MAEDRIQRRLAAIVVADVVGFSRLIREDEAGTLARLKSLREDIIDRKAADFGGRIVKTMGDGVLLEFASAVDAVRYAVGVQRQVDERHAAESDNSRIELRIGVNLGDVVVDGDDILGDGVNVAARLEGLAEPGGVCISASVHEQVKHQLDFVFEDMGGQSVKNIDEPVRAYRLATGRNDAKTRTEAVFTLPSIAVLPFENMSGDPEQEYFSDGITEDLITALSRIRQFRVIARNSTFAYKGSSPDVRKVAADLGVRYVIEGSVRKAGGRVRITAQLIDAADGSHIWADRHDRDLDDIFALQDELTETIVGAIEPELRKAEIGRARAKRPDNLDAWDTYLRGVWHVYQFTGDDIAKAKVLFREAIAKDPTLPGPYSSLGGSLGFEVLLGIPDNPGQQIREAIALAQQGVALDNTSPFSHHALGFIYYFGGESDGATKELETALRLNPSYAMAHHALGRTLTGAGKAEDAVPHIQTAIRLSPLDVRLGHFMAGLAEAHLCMRDHENAVEFASQAFRLRTVNWPGVVSWVSALGHLGRSVETHEALDELIELQPNISITYVRDNFQRRIPVYVDHVIDGLRKAGIPESPSSA